MTPIKDQIAELLMKCENFEWYDETFEYMNESLAPITHVHFCSVIVLLKRFPPQ